MFRLVISGLMLLFGLVAFGVHRLFFSPSGGQIRRASDEVQIDASPGAIELLPPGWKFEPIPEPKPVPPQPGRCAFCGTLWVPIGNCPNCAAPAVVWYGEKKTVVLKDATTGAERVIDAFLVNYPKLKP
jgi:hypothetical protein